MFVIKVPSGAAMLVNVFRNLQDQSTVEVDLQIGHDLSPLEIDGDGEIPHAVSAAGLI
jgi:hypothetical protein